jgi:hypothetical protein
MPKHEIGPKVLLLGIAAIIALVIVAVVALDAKDVALHLIDAVTSLGMEGAGA